MIARVLAAVALLAAGCDRASDASSCTVGADPRPEPPEPPHFVDPTAVAKGMHARFDELRELGRMLVAGNLAMARLQAAVIASASSDPGMAPWARKIAEVQAAARDVTRARTVDDALQRTVRISVACTDCHLATGTLPRFPSVPIPSQVPEMTQYQWAIDRMWEGMIGGSNEPWSAGLAVLGRTPSSQAAREPAELANRLQQLALRARDAEASDNLDTAAAAYGDILAACADCHAVRLR